MLSRLLGYKYLVPLAATEEEGRMKGKNSGNSRLVYSSESGRICPGCSRPVAQCSCRGKTNRPAGDGIVRVQRETKGRGGKTVTLVTGVPLDEAGVKNLAGELKKR